jgi:hypothetical protein
MKLAGNKKITNLFIFDDDTSKSLVFSIMHVEQSSTIPSAPKLIKTVCIICINMCK